MAVLTLKAKQDHLQKVASTRDPIKGLAEFVWNALDADATQVEINFQRNALGGVEAIIVRDNGTGISHDHAKNDFENIGASWKRNKHLTANKRAIHGKEGQGRLRFFSIAQKAKWESVYKSKDKFESLTVHIEADALQKADVSEPKSTKKKSTGTIVELSHLKETFDWLSSDESRLHFSDFFSPYLLKYTDVKIKYDGIAINPLASIDRAYDFPPQNVIVSGKTIKNIEVKVIEWKTHLESRRLYFGGEQGVVLGEQPAGVTAPGFSFSAYAYSPFFQEIADANLLDFDSLADPDFAAVAEHLRELLGDYFRTRQAERSGALIDELKAKGIYPYEGDPGDEVEKREREVFDIATHAVSSYSREFKKANDPLKKITLRLLREAVKHNPDSVSQILHAVFDLPKKRQDEFAGLLNKAKLANIIAASSLIADRVSVLEILKSIVFEPKHRHTVKERGELDVLVQTNTWIFGENFHFTLAEKGLTKVMQRVALDLHAKKSRKKVRKLDGKIGRVDTFMGRVVPHPEGDFREYMLVELKKPSLTIKRKEVDQLEDYANAITQQPDYINTNTKWNFFLVTGDYDDVVKERVTQSDRPVGLFIDKPNHSVWVKTWSEIIRECEGRLSFIQKHLNVEVTDEEIEERISLLKKSILKIPDQQ